MRPPRALVLIAVGLLLVGVDFRTSAIDLLPDPIGWVLVAVGAVRLGTRAAASLAGSAALLGLSDVYLGFGYELVDPETGDVVETCPRIECAEFIRYDAVGPARATAIAVAAAVGCAAIVVAFRTIRRRLRIDPDTRWTRPALGVFEIVLPLAWVLPIVVGVATAASRDLDDEPVWTGGAEFVAEATAVVVMLAALTTGWLAKTEGRSLERDAPSAQRPISLGRTTPD